MAPAPDRAKAKFPSPTPPTPPGGSYTDFIDVPRRNGLVLVVWLAISLLLRLINGAQKYRMGNSDGEAWKTGLVLGATPSIAA